MTDPRHGLRVATRFLLVLFCAVMLPWRVAGVEPWPAHPVKIVVPFSAAGTADLLARIVADKLTAAFGQPFILEHRPGAGGVIGQEQVAHASPNGYTLVVSSLGSFLINPVFTPVSFDPFRDFAHIAYLGGQPLVLAVKSEARYRSLSDLVDYAKTNPGAVTYATISIGSQSQLLNEQFAQRAGIVMTHIPYRGAGQIITDVLGGHIGAGLTALTVAAGQLSSGALRGLGISSTGRLTQFPDVPTYSEQGYPEIVASAWFALSGPANLPREIVDRLNTEVVKALHAPDVEPRLRIEAIDTKTLDADAFTAFFRAEAERWTPLAKAVAGKVRSSGGR